MASLQGLFDFYNEAVEELDKKGYAELYKKCAEAFFEELSKDNFTATDIEYLDGYYIFAYGTNSVVHFHIKECPGWKFAIWWNEPDENKITGEFFTQYEKDIDKFKPSRSSYCYTISCFDYKESVGGFYDWYSSHALKFIKEHPILAWGRDYCGYDYNVEYVNPLKVGFKFYKHIFEEWEEETVENFLNKLALRYANKHIIPLITEGESYIEDRGDSWSPRFHILCKVPEDTPEEELGCFGLTNEDEVKKYLKKLEKIAKFFGIYFYCPYHPDVIFYTETN